MHRLAQDLVIQQCCQLLLLRGIRGFRILWMSWLKYKLSVRMLREIELS
jgi:hypothetical protein|uniref:Uncharacterized protein n=1 Tax=Picea sitchensis TaxID=3332 RepID=A0A6B9XU54_PICSI|nr:hypothetical protein Q903MT_gene3913 [Picea sitchensis]